MRTVLVLFFDKVASGAAEASASDRIVWVDVPEMEEFHMEEHVMGLVNHYNPTHLITVGKRRSRSFFKSLSLTWIHFTPFGLAHILQDGLLLCGSELLEGGDSLSELASMLPLLKGNNIGSLYRPVPSKYRNFVDSHDQFSILYVGGLKKKRKKSIYGLVRKCGERVVIVAESKLDYWYLMWRFCFKGGVTVLYRAHAFPLLSLLKKCNRVFVSSWGDALDGWVLQKAMAFFSRDALHESWVFENDFKEKKYIIPASYLLKGPFVLALVNAWEEKFLPMISPFWEEHYSNDARNPALISGFDSLKRKFNKMVSDPEKFALDSNVWVIRLVGALLFKKKTF